MRILDNCRTFGSIKPGIKVKILNLLNYRLTILQVHKDLVESLKNVQAIVQWPKKSDRQNDLKDQTKWCDFHGDHGHMTKDCINLRKEVAYLSPKVHMKDIVRSNVTITKDVRPPSPEHTKVVNCITRGSEVCGLTYSAAKRHVRQGQMIILSHNLQDLKRNWNLKL